MSLPRLFPLGGAVAIAVALTLAPLTLPAFASAIPIECTQTWSSPYVGSGGLIKGYGSANCTTVGSRTFKLALIHDFNSPFPDVTVVTAADGGYQIKYSTSFSVCDNGGTTKYYNKAYFSGYAGGVSPSVAFAHC